MIQAPTVEGSSNIASNQTKRFFMSVEGLARESIDLGFIGSEEAMRDAHLNGEYDGPPLKCYTANWVCILFFEVCLSVCLFVGWSVCLSA